MNDDVAILGQGIRIAGGIIQRGIIIRLNVAVQHDDHRERPLPFGNVDESV
jgi:hypothetical protein